MLTVTCPQCSANLKLKQAPPAGKVKCPKCSAIVPVSAAPAKAPGAAGGPIDPDDDRFDFGRINFPSASGVNAVSQFPVAGEELTPYMGPIPGDPLEAVEQEGDAEAAAEEVGTIGPATAPKKNPAVLIGVLGGVGILLIMGIVGAVMMFSGGGGGSGVDVVAEAQSAAPEGFTAFGAEGVVVLMPKGYGSDKLPSVIECNATKSSATGSVYFLGAMNGGKREIDAEQMRKKAGRQLGGEILGKSPVKRNGYEGIKGILDGSIFLPRMQVEIFHHDERFVILGAATESFASGIPASNVEKQESDVFYKSFKIGPAPSGWFGN